MPEPETGELEPRGDIAAQEGGSGESLADKRRQQRRAAPEPFRRSPNQMRELLKEGLADSAAGRVRPRESYAQYANDPDEVENG